MLKNSEKMVAVEMNPGDVLLFSSLLIHGTPPNKSLKTRRAIQYHFVPKNYPRTSDFQRLSTFGKMVICFLNDVLLYLNIA